MKQLYYFGTNLSEAGHYFWKVHNTHIERRGLIFDQFPFDPERLTEDFADVHGNKPDYNKLKKGAINFYQIEGFSIIRIEGAPADARGGTKSVFFIESKLSYPEIIERINNNPMALKLIDKMPFDVNF